VPRAFLPDLVVSREKRIVIEVSGKKSSIHDRTKVEFYYKHGIRWIEITNETVKITRSREGDIPGARGARPTLSSRKSLGALRILLEPTGSL
jgi:hypothetical protein